MNEFESKLTTLLNERVDVVAGPERPAPAFHPLPRVAHLPRKRRPRAFGLPLLAAACVAAIAGATIGVVHATDGSVHSPATRPPAQPTTGPATIPVPPAPTTAPTTRPAAPTSPPSSHHSAPTSPTTRPSSRGVNSAAGDLVRLGAARVWLPAGWSANADTGQGVAQWSLCPRETTTACVFLTALTSARAGENGYIDVDHDGFVGDGPQFVCSADRASTVHEQVGRRPFGGRVAEWREWDHTCPGKAMPSVVQYVVDSYPGFALITADGTDAMRADMTAIAQRSTLPAQSRPLWLMDRGTVRSLTPVGADVQMTVNRLIWVGPKFVPNTPATATYLVPKNVLAQANGVRVGTRVTVDTDGTRVLDVQPDLSVG